MNVYTVRFDGEANVCHIMKEQNWFARIQFNGEMTVTQQEAAVRAILDALNAENRVPGVIF